MYFDPLDPEYLADPYPVMRQLRDASPVHYVEHLDLWAVSRYEDVRTVLRDPEVFSSRLALSTGWRLKDRRVPEKEISFQAGIPGVEVLVGSDPPAHTRLRRLLGEPFTRDNIRSVESQLRTIVDSESDKTIRDASDGPVDLVPILAETVTARSLAHVIGFPPSMARELTSWAGAMANSWDPTHPLALASSYRRLARQGWGMLRGLLKLVEARSQLSSEELGDGLVDALVRARSEDPSTISDLEIVSNLVLLIIAGAHSTKSGIGSAFDLLVQRPDIFNELKADPTLVPLFVEEILRLESPVQTTWRGIREPVELGGVVLPADARLMVMIGSANRDEREYSEPDTFRMKRSGSKPTFGVGLHSCIGAFMAQLELKLVITTMIDRVQRIELAGQSRPTTNLIVRGMDTLPVRIYV